MAFKDEKEFQELIHKTPGIILDGIPEINPILCKNTPEIVSLGTEINIQGKRADNIFIDTNGILTIVECKLYGNQGIEREVYPQILNYASGIKEKLKDFDLTNEDINYASGRKEKLKDITDEDKYLDEFFNIIVKESEICPFENPEALIEYFKSEENMLGERQKDLGKWESQFKKYFKNNIEEEIFRLIIACAPSKEKINNDSNQKTVNNFDQNKIKNLIQIVNFSESKSNKYDLIIMDSRKKDKRKIIGKDNIVSRIIWRNYDSLREVPLISKYKREKLGEDVFYEKLKKNTTVNVVKKVKKIFNNFKNEDKNKIIDWKQLPIIKYKTKFDGNNVEFNFGQINDKGEYVGTHRLRNTFKERQNVKVSRWKKIKVSRWKEINNNFFKELQEIFPESKYREAPSGKSGNDWRLYLGEDGSKYPEIKNNTDVDKFNKVIDNFIASINKFLQDLN